MNKIILRKTQQIKECSIELPTSKSLANRVLIINALCSRPITIKKWIPCNDIIVLQNALQTKDTQISIEDAGTAARFMCAYLALQPNEYVLTGTERMKQRPIQPLVDALLSMGAQISYIDNSGYLPIRIKGSRALKNEVYVDSTLSSQFISALMLIAPVLNEGLLIRFNNPVSASYIEMTSELMAYFGVSCVHTPTSIYIAKQDYTPTSISIESDWSSASYFFSFAALMPQARLLLKNLSVYSLQGDRVCSYIASMLGAETHLLGDDIAVRNHSESSSHFDYDFMKCPDLVMTFAVLCAIKNIPATFRNIHHLAYKESNRLEALSTELKKIGAQFYEKDGNWILYPSGIEPNKTYHINTYNDHRMAMSFAPLAMCCNEVVINDAFVVTKSFPHFWEEITKLGISIEDA